ncbi:MAG: glutamyl-tRNA(Gln) amidotransferase subunit D [Candidatus Altiarchaeales archaeon IMC4]|nr:MAG: glutamyl-tRNA(Gln) amidotransferase subunit D [Candidatus Altiarchaeales archaeon IMC4]
MERPELADDRHIVLKLESGYNVGIKKDAIKGINVIGRPKTEKFEIARQNSEKNLPKVSILATGGTIASRVDYITGGVKSAFSADELISAVPELGAIADVSGRQIFNKFSENINPDDWVAIANAVHEEIKKGAGGIVVTHGTDTMGYTAAALSFMLKTPVPVVLTGAQRSSDRGSSDAALNLISAVNVAANADLAEVCVVMHAEASDSYCMIHRGTRVRKMHTSGRSAFRSVNCLPIGKIEGGKIEYFTKTKPRGGELVLDAKMQHKVALIKYYPGMAPETIINLVDTGCRGLVIEGTGLGHVSEDLFGAVKYAAGKIPIAMASQTIHGAVNMNVYSTGRELLKMGVMPLGDMLAETAYVKMMWVLGHTADAKKAMEMMLTNYAWELGERSIINEDEII